MYFFETILYFIFSKIYKFHLNLFKDYCRSESFSPSNNYNKIGISGGI